MHFYLMINTALYIYSNVLLFGILIANLKFRKQGTSDRLFNHLLMTTIYMLFFDLISRFDGLSQPIYPFLNHVGNFFLFLFNPLISIIWFMYIHYEIYSNEKMIKRFTIGSIPILLFNAFLVIGSLFNGWIYYIDAENIYHRGSMYMLPEVMSVTVMIITFGMLILERKRFTKNHFLLYLIFGLIPGLALIAQSVHYGISYSLNAIALAITILYIFVQNKRMKSDYLTGTFNRRQLDYYLQDKIKAAKKHETFTSILVDIDDFKMINDSFGHPVGDQALIKVAEIIKDSISDNDFLARFGGDEFFVVTNLNKLIDVERIIQNVHENIRKFNETSDSFKLQASIGYCVYNKEVHHNLTDFHKAVDKIMYESKILKK